MASSDDPNDGIHAAPDSPPSVELITPEERQSLNRAWKQALTFPQAAQPEIIRADQKDAYFIATLQDMLESSLRGIVSARWLTSRSDDLRDIGRTIYYLLTTLSGSQTLGEEYCDIVPVDARTGDFPSLRRRALYIFARIYSPRILSTLYARLRSRLRPVEQASEQVEGEIPSEGRIRSTLDRLRHTLSHWLSLLPNRLDLSAYHTVAALHLSIFYLTGRYFNWSNRLTRIRYLSTQLRPMHGESGVRIQPPSYEFLGLLMVVQLLVKATVSLKNAQRRRLVEQSIEEATTKNDISASSGSPKGKGVAKDGDENLLDRPPIVDGISIDEILFEAEDDSSDVDDPDSPSINPGVYVEGVEIDPTSHQSTSHRCTLCLGPKVDQSSLECGHVFCWRCVVGWVREKPECPLCRQAVKMTDLLPLYNF